MKAALALGVAVLALGGCAQEKVETQEDIFVRHMGQVAIPGSSLERLAKDREELLRKGHEACDGLKAGKAQSDVELATGLPRTDDANLVIGAQRWLCPGQ